MEKIIEQSFTLYMSNVEWETNPVECILHSVELLDNYDCRDEYVGHVTITIEDSEHGTQTYAIWGNGEENDEYKNDFGGCYICLPTMLEVDVDDELEVLHYDELMGGME